MQKCGASEPAAFPDDCAEHVAALNRGITECDPPGVTVNVVVDRFVAVRPFLRVPAFVFAAGAVLAVVAWFTSVFVGASLLFVTVAFALTALAPTILREHLVGVLRAATAARRESILSRVETEMRAEIDRVIDELKSGLTPLAQSGSRERADAQPMLTRILQLAELFDRSIDEIEMHELRPTSVAESSTITR
jgi:hypothetical protein